MMTIRDEALSGPKSNRPGLRVLAQEGGAMSQFTHAFRRSPSRGRLAACALVVPLAASALVWVGRVSAAESGRSPAAVSKSVSNVPTAKADALDATNTICTVSPNFNDMPGTSKKFSLGGSQSRPVIVLFQGEWFSNTEGSAAFIQLAIDGKVQSGPSSVVVAHRPFGEPQQTESHGFNFVSDPLVPGTHTATIQWADNGQGPYCVRVRSLIVLHK